MKRRNHILQEFGEKNEFDIHLVEPVSHSVSVVSLWKTIQYILRDLAMNDVEFIIFCEDDHQFTSAYSKEFFLAV